MKLKSLGTGDHHHCFSILIWEPINSIPLAGGVSRDFFAGGVNHMVFREKRGGGQSSQTEQKEGDCRKLTANKGGGSFEHYEPLKEGGGDQVNDIVTQLKSFDHFPQKIMTGP